MSALRIERLTFDNEQVTVSFSDGRRISVALSRFPRLQSASAQQREEWQLIGRGLGVHWEALDEDLSVENFLIAYSRSRVDQYAVPATP